MWILLCWHYSRTGSTCLKSHITLHKYTHVTCPMAMETSFHYYYYYHLQILKAIVVVYTIKTSMSNVWQLSGGCL